MRDVIGEWLGAPRFGSLLFGQVKDNKGTYFRVVVKIIFVNIYIKSL